MALETTEQALWHFRRSLSSLPNRIGKRQAPGLETRVQEMELEALPWAISALEFTLAWEQYESAEQK